MIWNVVRVVGARERTVAGELHRGLGLRTYYPIEVCKITRKARTIESSRPLMPCYLFVGHHDGMPWRDIAATKGVIDWLTVDDDVPAVVSDAEIDRIRQLEREFNRAKVDTRTRALCVRDRVRINKGPFANMETLLTAIKGSHVEFATPLGKVSVPAAAVTLVA